MSVRYMLSNQQLRIEINDNYQIMTERDKKTYEKLLGDEQRPVETPSTSIGFLIHAVLKVIVLAIFLAKGLFSTIFSDLVINQLLAIFVVIDFWFTKNVTGKKMIGIRWFFQDDQYGTQKFYFECRANSELVSTVGPKLFWIVQLFYTILPLLFIIVNIVAAPFIFINFGSIAISLIILIGGGANIFFFYKASSASAVKQNEIKKKLGTDMVRKLGLASITSYA